MAQRSIDKALAQEALDAFTDCGGVILRAARKLGLPEGTYRNRLIAARRHGMTPGGKGVDDSQEDLLEAFRNRIRELETAIAVSKRETLSDEWVKHKIVKLAESEPTIPEWMVKTPKKEITGVPTLFASDWHWAEVVDKNQIGGVNEYNISIAQQRAKSLVETAIHLLRDHLKITEYPGIVFALGGDMVSGDIHEELSVSNELEMMPTVLDLWGVLAWCIDTLATEFGNVFVPCVTGNHGRNTHKIRAKGRNFTSFDWLVYQFLAKRFENDPRVKFLIPDGSDAYYQIYGHRYLLTHGDQFRGGDGMIGALGPIIRGDHKKRSRNAQIDKEYDTLLLGHWHQLIQLQRLIVNGSLKGYDEYAFQNNFPFEPPRQALWVTHPEHGITFSAPVQVERRPAKRGESWVSWKA
jgi:hypothetical protein